jgi:ABC-2 type transport system permease protein
MTFAQAVAYRGAGLDIVWPDLIATAVLGLAFFAGSLMLFRRSMAVET